MNFLRISPPSIASLLVFFGCIGCESKIEVVERRAPAQIRNFAADDEPQKEQTKEEITQQFEELKRRSRESKED